jgi:hypothetical protein
MARKRSPTESSDKAVETAVAADGARTPMERFRAVARRLATIPRDELEEERRRYEDEQERRKRGAG